MSREEDLQHALHTLKPGKQLKPLNDVVTYCKRQNKDPADFWPHIPAPVMERLDEAQLAIIQDTPQEKCYVSEDSLKIPEYQLHLASLILTGTFKVAIHGGQVFPLQVTDAEHKVVAPTFEGDADRLLARMLSRTIKSKMGLVVGAKLAKDMVEVWLNHADTIPMPKPMAKPEEDIWCFHRANHEPDSSVAINRWLNILNRMSDAKAFAAWVWGVYSCEYKGRQVLWLHGKHGEDGKSLITQLIASELFGPAHNAISNASLGASEKRFLASYFENASLVIYPDASNRRCLMSETFKTVASAGSDPVLIERKGKQAYTSYLKARMWVCSNFAPEITNDNYILSRLLYIDIDKMDEKPDPKVRDDLKAELPGFLHYAKQAYEERCPDNYKIVSIDDTETRVKRMAEDFFEEYEVIFNKYWEFCGQDEFVDAAKVRDITRKEGLTSNHDHKNFITWLTEKRGVVKRKISQEGGKIRYQGMRKRRPVTSTSSPSAEQW